ncbi:hypothetical protein [Desulfogranum mediterraneum]|uniref:hypothetical protein n=1 Tax=Desulfogranum mediterraneum TaxID=160661 RepID=UPI0005526A83|nr:hypothetical protein [Desulfogranum mediterraneum]
MMRTSVKPDGTFRVGIHQPRYGVINLRQHDHILTLGALADGTVVENRANFTPGDLEVTPSHAVYEILNPLPFRGCTYIDAAWADRRRQDPTAMAMTPPGQDSLLELLLAELSQEKAEQIFARLPGSVRYDLAQNSTKPEELVMLARGCCRFVGEDLDAPEGLSYREVQGRRLAEIDDHRLFETIANNPALPDPYKEVMVLRPGAQGGSEIVADFNQDQTALFEYHRGNSYIPGGHFAANFAHNAIRYRIGELSATDMEGLRHLYYQRSYVVLAEKLGIETAIRRRRYSPAELEALRRQLVARLERGGGEQVATLWGWNFGYDFSGSGYRLHASHQMIHQQYALVPEQVESSDGEPCGAFACGDLVADWLKQYHQAFGSSFFSDYLRAIRTNTRVDGGRGEQSLVVWEDPQVLLFVPKAQVSQWELQLMVIADSPQGPVGNIVEADQAVRTSLDQGILRAQQVLAALGARMVTSVEYSKRLGVDNGQRLLYSFSPKLPWSMGGFSEAQSRYICGHYPEDFAAACRQMLEREE